MALKIKNQKPMTEAFDSLDESKVIREAAAFEARYADHFEDLYNESPLSKVRKITKYDEIALGRQLAQVEGHIRMIKEDNGSVNQLGVSPKIALDVVSVLYGSSIVPVIASVQPIAEQRGLVYFKSAKAQNTKGNMTANDDIMNPYSGMKTPNAYAGNAVSLEVVGTGNGALISFTATLANKPVAGSLQISIESAPATIIALDDYKGVITGTGVSGTINYSSGVVVLNFAVAVVNDVDVYVSYGQNYESSTDIPQIQSYYDSATIDAAIYALKSTMGLFQAFQLKQRFGISAEEEISKDLISAMNAELGGDLIRKMAAAAVGNTAFTYTISTSSDNYYGEKQRLFDAIFTTAGSVITANAGRGIVNLIIAGNTAAASIQTLPGFVQITDGNSIGCHLLGTLNGIPVVRVIETDMLAANVILCAYKGTSPFEAPAVYAPYMPITNTALLPMGLNPLMQQKAIAVWAGTKVLVQNFITKITITYV